MTEIRPEWGTFHKGYSELPPEKQAVFQTIIDLALLLLGGKTVRANPSAVPHETSPDPHIIN